jgi:hypothetical protein
MTLNPGVPSRTKTQDQILREAREEIGELRRRLFAVEDLAKHLFAQSDEDTRNWGAPEYEAWHDAVQWGIERLREVLRPKENIGATFLG